MFEDCGIICRFSQSSMTLEHFEWLLNEAYEDLLSVDEKPLSWSDISITSVASTARTTHSHEFPRFQAA